MAFKCLGKSVPDEGKSKKTLQTPATYVMLFLLINL